MQDQNIWDGRTPAGGDQEDRRFVRVVVPVPIGIKRGDQITRYRSQVVRDISTHGLGIVLLPPWPEHWNELVEGDELFDLVLYLPDVDPVAVVANKVWMQIDGQGDRRTCLAGFEFCMLSEEGEERLREFIQTTLGGQSPEE